MGAAPGTCVCKGELGGGQGAAPVNWLFQDMLLQVENSGCGS